MRGHANVRGIVSCCLKHGKVLSDEKEQSSRHHNRDDNGIHSIDETDALDGGEIEVALHQRLVRLDDIAYLLLNGFDLLVKQ